MSTLLLLIACQAAPDAPESTPIPATEHDCPAGETIRMTAQGAVSDAVVVAPNGALVAPWILFEVQMLTVQCPSSGGTIHVDWHED